MNSVSVTDIGRTRYAEAWRLQQQLWDLRYSKVIGDVLLYTEHEHVYTIGKGGDGNHLLASKNELETNGIDFFQIDRGGDVTYHGPGQVVGYPIIDLSNYVPDLHRYLRNLEEVIILALKSYGIEGTREEGFTGVWVKGNKIAAIGVKVSRWVAMHGFALNVNTDLAKFNRIIPCGIFHKGVTSMQSELGKQVALEDVQEKLSKAFETVFECETRKVKSLDLMTETLGIEPLRQELSGEKS